MGEWDIPYPSTDGVSCGACKIASVLYSKHQIPALCMAQEFTEAEIATIRELLTQRFRKDIEIQLSHSDVALSSDQDFLTKCPTVFWHVRDANFVVTKTDNSSYRTQFFYTPHDQFGTGVEVYGDLKQCIDAVLQSQSEYEKKNHGVDTVSAERSFD